MLERTRGTELESRWSAWLLERNRRGTRIVLWLVILLYPLFGVLDYLLASRAWLWVAYGIRLVICLVTLVMFRVVRTPTFERRYVLLSSSYMILAACGISLMTVDMGGLASPYYAGLSLAMVATSLLFLWPRSVVVTTHASVVLSFVLPNVVANGASELVTSISNLFFLVSTAVVAGTGQILAYRTQREQVESQLVIERTKANLEQAHETLKQLDRFKSEFFANVTHELKTPLTLILSPIELMLQGEMGRLTEAQRGTLESMLRSGMKLLTLIGDLLDLSKLTECRLRLSIREHDLVGFLSGLTAQVRPLAERKAIELTFESNREECPIHCDIERLERVFVNLLSNAAKFTPSRGHVRITLEDRGPTVSVYVEDDGIGFPPEKADSIFERFCQIDMASTRKFGGTGIGLSLARELVRLHGGDITGESDGKQGAKFAVVLRKGYAHFDPAFIDRRTQKQDRSDGQRESDLGLGEWHVEARNRFRLLEVDEATEQRVVLRDPDELGRAQSVLVVEDTRDVIRMIHLTLRNHFRVFAATGGEKGFDLAIKYQPSLIITDLMMPGMDGLELTRKIRTDARTRHIPIIMLTARSHSADRTSGFEAGVSAYLAKPFAASELVSTVRGLIRIQEATTDIVLTREMDSLQTIAGGLAHEINNPLNYVRNAITLLQEDVSTLLGAQPAELQVADRARRMFQVAEAGLQRIAATVSLMQRYSREGYTRVAQPLDVFTAARVVIATLESGVEQQVIETSFQGDGTIECVPEEMHQVLTNLIQNALDAIPQDGSGRVHVLGVGEGDAVMLWIKDNGCGIQPEHRGKIFTPFFTTKDVGRGMGLGLSIARRVVDSLGGTIQVSSDVGIGTEVSIHLPRRERSFARSRLVVNRQGDAEESAPVTGTSDIQSAP